MAYATLSDLQTRLGSNVDAADPGLYDQLTDRVDAEAASATVGTAALNWASARMNAKLGARYLVPISTADAEALAFLRAMCLDMAGFRLWSSAAQRELIPQRVLDSWNDAVELLREIVAGDGVLPSAIELSSPIAQGDVADSGGDTRVFTPSNLGQM